MNEKLTRLWDEAVRTGEPVSIGNIVVCDACNRDFTDSEEWGGMIFGGYAYCPACTAKHLPSIRELGEEHFIQATCPSGQSFADFVRAWRGPNPVISVRRAG
jgi:hypothetical protein